MDLNLSGLASGFDWKPVVQQLVDLERVPQRRLLSEQDSVNQRSNAYNSIETQLGVLKNRIDVLTDPLLFDSRTASVSDEEMATSAVEAGTALGTYEFAVTQLATVSTVVGASDVGSGLSPTDDVSGLLLSDANFATSVTAGVFTVNGNSVTVDLSDSLQDVFDAINTATSGLVSASYDSANDQISLSSASEIVLGSATDTSNFLQRAKLFNNGTGSVTSSTALGTVHLTDTLSNADFSTTVTDGGSGAGLFRLNGVDISFDASVDTASDVITRINESSAEVTASYDAVNDRFQLTSNATGDMGISLEDVTGNFLAASGLSGGTLTRGQNMIYTLNGGGSLVSLSNTVTEESHGVSGLTVNFLEGVTSVDVTVSSDTEKIKSAITGFVDEYNNVQALISSQTAISIGADGEITTGLLSNERQANEIATKLRSLTFGGDPLSSDPVRRLADLGYDSNSNDNSLSFSDPAVLDDLLVDGLSDLRTFFTDSTSGLAVEVDEYLDQTIGEDGTLAQRRENLGKQSQDIDTQIAEMEKQVLRTEEQLIASFVAMEQAQSRINQQLQFLTNSLAGI